MPRIQPVCVLVFLVVQASASAEPRPWMKVENPNQLPVRVLLSTADCPFERFVLDQSVDDELLRARVKRGRGSGVGAELYLLVSVGCVQQRNMLGRATSVLFTSNIRFGSDHGPRFPEVTMFYGDAEYSWIGFAESKSIRDLTQKLVSDALTDYLKANFEQ